MLFKVCDEAHLIEPCYSQGSPFFFICRLELFQTPVCSCSSLIITLAVCDVWAVSGLCEGCHWMVAPFKVKRPHAKGSDSIVWEKKKCWNTIMRMCVTKGICDFPWKLWKLVCLNVKGFPQGYLTPSFHFFLQPTFFFSFVSHRNTRAHRSARLLYFS